MTETKTKKPTKKDIINKILLVPAIAENSEYVDFLTHELELLEKKNSSKGTSKTAIENEVIIDLLVNELAKLNRPVTISELMQESQEIKNFTYGKDNTHLTNQKISALLNKCEDKVNKTIDKKKSYFSVK